MTFRDGRDGDERNYSPSVNVEAELPSDSCN